MNGLRILLFGIGVLIIVYNFFINSANIIKIVGFCFQTNSVSEYWKLFFKSCASARAIISTIIGFVLAMLIYVIITPIVLFRKATIGKKTAEMMNTGLLFQYPDLDIEHEDLRFTSNINTYMSINLSEIKVSGKIRVDALIVISELDKQCKLDNKTFSYQVMCPIKLNNKKDAIIPLFLTIDNKNYPAYFIYDEGHKQQYQKVKSLLAASGHRECLYFSTIPI